MAFENVQANAGSGGAKFATQRYTVGADQLEFPVSLLGLFVDETTAPVEAKGDATNGLDVDVTRLPALPAGTNNIGDVDVLTLPTLPAGDNNIGNVDVVTLPALPAGMNNIGDVDVLTVPADPFGANADAAVVAGAAGSIQAKLRRLSSDLDSVKTAVETLDNAISGSEMQVDVVTSALPSGASTAANQATANTALAAIQAAVEILDNAISGSEIQADVLTVPADPFGLNADAAVAAGAAGSIQAKLRRLTSDLDAVKTAVETLDNAIAGSEMQVDVLTLPSVTVGAALPAGTNNIGDVDVVSLPALPAGTNNIGDVDVLSLPALPAGSNSIGTVVDGGSGKTLKRAVVSLTGDADVVALVASKRIKVYAWEIQSRNDTMTVQFKSNNAAGAALGARWGFNTREGAMGSAVNPPAFLFATVAGEALYAALSGTGTVDIAVSYWDDDAA